MCFSAYLTNVSLQQYLESDVATNLVTTTGRMFDDVSFPKMYICNVYKLRFSFINAMFNHTGRTERGPMVELNKAFHKEFITGYSHDENVEQLISNLYETMNSTLLTFRS